ncbi:hypothetical protein [Kribbella qitaiheensis]|uniref:hypothetical protein n=1 Tax=Kribbella qitaiheensis TaxID=1544730 RepID=UPI001FE7D1D4|nr:hypothetical protein [Kribbella qitaiheensis]
MVRLNLPPGHSFTEDEIQIVAQSISGATERLAIWRTKHPAPPTPAQTATTLMTFLWQGLNTLRG